MPPNWEIISNNCCCTVTKLESCVSCGRWFFFFRRPFLFVFSVFVECLENGECPKTTRINVIIHELDALSRNVNDAGFNHIVIFQVHSCPRSPDVKPNQIMRNS